MDSMVIGLQRKILDPNVLDVDVLRSAYSVAVKLGLEEFKAWINNELNGYQVESQLPSYRTVHCELKVNDPYRGWTTVQVPEHFLDTFCKRPIRDSLPQLSYALASPGDCFYFPFQGDTLCAVQKFCGCNYEAGVFVQYHVFSDIISSVRNKLLEWSLELEANGILGDGLEFSLEDKREARMTEINIHSFNGVLGDVTDSTVTQNINVQNIDKGDFDSLASFLSSQKIPSQDIESLRAAIEKDGNVSGSAVGAWTIDVLKKSASGLLGVPADVTIKVITSALERYFGV